MTSPQVRRQQTLIFIVLFLSRSLSVKHLIFTVIRKPLLRFSFRFLLSLFRRTFTPWQHPPSLSTTAIPRHSSMGLALTASPFLMHGTETALYYLNNAICDGQNKILFNSMKAIQRMHFGFSLE